MFEPDALTDGLGVALLIHLAGQLRTLLLNGRIARTDLIELGTLREIGANRHRQGESDKAHHDGQHDRAPRIEALPARRQRASGYANEATTTAGC